MEGVAPRVTLLQSRTRRDNKTRLN